ncbi:N-methylhydantoinase A/oxoprolinase/acetone carboxylase beta subunit [Desulfohalotomaculum tongense]|uniref:hydantoinase/oxoprolinase family protein n=1 Tax=Desulforadius tongensis TaxID=1216062 RepID=UPI0019592ABD|nr:N-methylhydantoinase A/oxoprolinase/acetone carboxylase beta subunit [Desulforadius tongensis]
MYIGIDVGGTCTDAVLLSEGKVRSTAKIYNTPNNLLTSLVQALDSVMKGVSAGDIERVVLSTTMITNLIVERKYDPVGLLIMPGPGRKLEHYRNADVHILSGAIDYRGREIIPVNEEEVLQAIKEFDAKGYNKVAVVGKFSPRNNRHELQVAELVKKHKPHWQVEMGHRAGGQLNFPRRVDTTVLTCATKEKYRYFVQSVNEALKKRDIKAQVFIMKADGGTMTLESSEQSPVETIFSGPAASTLGAQALTAAGETSLVVDIGGTTTDLALILSGKPLLSSKGVMVGDKLTQVRTLAVKSVPVGGDSVVEMVGKELIIYSERMGQPYCLGGPFPTPTDALNVMGLTRLGDKDRAWEAMSRLGKWANMSPVEVAKNIINLVVDTIVKEIENMFLEWEQEPAYRIWEVMQKRRVRPQNVVGVGGGAAGFVPQIAIRIGGTPVLPPYASVANAIGAAVARPTLQVTMRADTEQNIFSIEEDGYQGKINRSPFGFEQALDLAKEWLINKASRMNIGDQMQDVEITRREVFNIVRDLKTTGKIYDICVQTPRGIQWHIGAGGKLI